MHVGQCSHSSDLQVLAIENDVDETEQHREPIPDHRVVGLENVLLARWRIFKATLWTLEHLRDELSEHRDRDETDPLEFADFAKIGNAHSKIGKRAVMNDRREMIPVDHGHDVECVGSNALCNLVRIGGL